MTKTLKNFSLNVCLKSAMLSLGSLNENRGREQLFSPSPNLFRGAAAPNETIVEIENRTYAVEERIDSGYNTTY